MKKLTIIALNLLIPAFSAAGQAVDTSAEKAARYFAEEKQVADRQTIWPKKLYGPMMMVDPKTRMTWANQPDSLSVLKPVGSVYYGVLPADIIIASTAIDWEGKRWSVIVWPTPANRNTRLALMSHELFHRIQQSLNLPMNDPTASHLGSYEGRLYFVLELAALKAAINDPADKRQTDLANALMFREKRRLTFPATAGNERLLEMNEGMAEYTGVMVGREKDSIKNYLVSMVDHIDSRPTLIRSMAYVTGPIYGYLLYQQNPKWNYAIDSTASFPALIKQYYHIQTVPEPTAERIAAAIKRYHAEPVVEAEKAREQLRLDQAARYIDLFTKKPVVEIHLKKMNIGFNPSILFDLADYGTVYPTARITDVWGELLVSKAMLMKDWKVVYLPAGDTLNTAGDKFEGDGWQLNLKPGWQVKKTDELHYSLVQN